jgi:dTDP-glucose pyrophosphorylase
MWGIIPAAGKGSRIQPLAFSKELLPVGSRFDGQTERPLAVSEYLVERMIQGGASKICFVVSPGKSDILEYYGSKVYSADVCYTVQNQPSGLCDAIFRALPFISEDEHVLVGLPDTIWFPEDGFTYLDDGILSFLLFPVDRPEFFDAVVTDVAGRVQEIQVKSQEARSKWVWGAFKMPARVFADSTALGWSVSDRTSTSALWSTPTWRGAVKQRECMQGDVRRRGYGKRVSGGNANDGERRMSASETARLSTGEIETESA